MFCLALGLAFSSFLFLSCNSEKKEREKHLVNEAKSIIINNEASSAYEVENTISSIKNFLSEYPDSKYYNELSGYIDELYLCLDFHKVKECNEKFDKLSTKTYYDVNDAIIEQESYLDEFATEYGTQLLIRQPQLSSQIDQVMEIIDEFETMKEFFAQDFYDLVSFNSEVASNSYKYINSSFETIQLSWHKIADNQRNEQASKDMNKKVSNFEEYLKSDAEKICNYNYKDFEVDDNKYTQTISIGSHKQHDTYNAKVCEGVFRVYLKGAYLGWDKGTAKISVKGMIVVTVDENQIKSGVEYRNLDFQILETTGDL